MAGTRTVYRGSRGRFAGASNGRAEKVRTGGFANRVFAARVASSSKVSKSSTSLSSRAGAKGKSAGKSVLKFNKKHKLVDKTDLALLGTSAGSAFVASKAINRKNDTVFVSAVLVSLGASSAYRIRGGIQNQRRSRPKASAGRRIR